jgi:predicted metal-dependent phosphoesterase TrpH
MSIRLDLHVHSTSHGRPVINAKQLIQTLKLSCLEGVAITNFSDISHALWLKKKLEEYIVIVGQEINTKDGHLMGLGLKENIPNCLSAEQTTAIIHDQGGLTVAVHPYLHLGLGKKTFCLPVDAVEVYNALLGDFFIYNFLAKKMAKKMNVTQLASTDTTDASLIGRSYTEVMTDNRDSILDTIRSGDVVLYKKSVPIPFTFIAKNILKVRDLQPWSPHAISCFICGKSMTVRLFREQFSCLDCGKTQMSRIVCCNGHYICKQCIINRGKRKFAL